MSTARCVLFCVLILLLVAVPAATQTYRDYFLYLSPQPSAQFVAPEATLILRPLDAYKATNWQSSLHVTGRVSGVHTGKWIVADDNETIIFKPHRPFERGETVTVSMDIGPEPHGSYSFQFKISRARRIAVDTDFTLNDSEWEEASGIPISTETTSQVGTTTTTPYTPPSNFPLINVTINDNPEEGYLFMANRGQPDPDPSYMFILSNDGFPVFFREMPFQATDFKKQPGGLLTYFDRLPERWRSYAMDNTYGIVDEWIPGNGYPLTSADVHDFLILPGGHAMLMIYDEQTVDMSEIEPGGRPAATVIGLVIQELDTSRNVVFQWRSWDHFQITDATTIPLNRPRIDYVHGNSMELDLDGNLLISSRSLEEVTKINRETGDVIWRMGGSQNEFTLVGATQWFSRQHDARRLPNGNITVFNNGNRNSPRESSAIEYTVDEVNKTATKVWEYRHSPPLYAAFTGNAQRLPNGNTLISWGNLGIVTEVRPDGTTAFEMNFVDAGTRTYRTFRFPWNGVAAVPTVWAETPSEQLVLHFTKFGDENVARYRIYRGDSPDSGEPVGSTTGSSFIVHGFESDAKMFFWVTAVDEGGNESPRSEMLAFSPDFADNGSNHYGAVADIHPKTLNASSKGKWVTAYIEMDEGCSCGPEGIDIHSIRMGTVSAESHPVSIGDNDADGVPDLMVKFSRAEVIAALPEGSPRLGTVSFAISGLMENGHFDDADSIRVTPPRTPLKPMLSDKYAGDVMLLHQNHPNPFNPTTVIRYDVPSGGGRVTIKIFNVGGQLVRTLVDRNAAPGGKTVTWDGKDSRGRRVSTGIYFYRLRAGKTTLTKKMVLLK